MTKHSDESGNGPSEQVLTSHDRGNNTNAASNKGHTNRSLEEFHATDPRKHKVGDKKREFAFNLHPVEEETSGEDLKLPLSSNSPLDGIIEEIDHLDTGGETSATRQRNGVASNPESALPSTNDDGRPRSETIIRKLSKIESLLERLDTRFREFEERLDVRMQTAEKAIDTTKKTQKKDMDACEKHLHARFTKMDATEAKCDRRFIRWRDRQNLLAQRQGVMEARQAGLEERQSSVEKTTG